MLIKIKHRYTGDVLFEVEAAGIKAALEIAVSRHADLKGAYLGHADLRCADLRCADLKGAYLGHADLGHADLRGADLRCADLRDADLGHADLRGAYGINPYRRTPLLMLLDQPGPIRAYKLVNAKLEGVYKGGLKYEIGKEISVDEANTDVNEQCGAGINLATLNWCMREWHEGHKILICEFTAEDIAAIPTATDGKFRVKRCKIIGEKDLNEIGLTDKQEAAA